MRVRFLSPLLITLFGLIVSATAQEPASTFARSRGNWVQRTYCVADLMVPLDSMRANFMMDELTPLAAACAKDACRVEPPLKALPAAKPQPTSCAAPAATCEEHLMKLIQHTISPTAWNARGGRATLDYCPLGMALVINADQEMHEQIDGLLRSLRRNQEVTVAVEMRVLRVPEGCWEHLGIHCCQDPCERLGIDFGVATEGKPPAVAGPGAMPVNFLNEKQVRQLLEMAQQNPRVTVCAAPKLTVMNGQQATIQIGTEHRCITGMDMETLHNQMVHRPREQVFFTGIKLAVQPTASADRRTIQFKLRAENTQLFPGKIPLFPMTTFITPQSEGGSQGAPVPFTQYIQQPALNTQALEKVVCIPEGATVVLSGLKQAREAAQAAVPPVLSRIPYVSRLFAVKQCQPESEDLIILATPRLVVQKDETRTVKAPPMVAPLVKKAPPMVAPPAAMPIPIPRMELPRPVVQAAYGTATPLPAPTAAGAFRARQVAKLMEMYQEACGHGHHDEARKLAAFALELDPTCFSKSK